MCVTSATFSPSAQPPFVTASAHAQRKGQFRMEMKSALAVTARYKQWEQFIALDKITSLFVITVKASVKSKGLLFGKACPLFIFL